MKDFILGDCMDYLPDFADNYFDLAIVDPPYGIGEDGLKNHSRGKATKPTLYTPKEWDKSPPIAEYFKELQRVSEYQIIWGGNHFIENIPNANSSSWIIWDKQNGNNDFADAELAHTSFTSAVRIFKFRWAGMLQGDMKNKEQRIHPTQKPVQLYKWLLRNYAQSHFKVLSTHVGSASDLIAFEDFGCEYVGYEIDEDYYKAACKRLEIHKRQLSLF